MVRLQNGQPHDLCALGRVHTVELGSVYPVRSLDALSTVHTLRVHHCDVEDVRSLGELYALCVEHCPCVREVGALGRVHTLVLKQNGELRSVARLHSVHTLCVRGSFHPAEDATASTQLGDVHILSVRAQPADAYRAVCRLDLSASTDLLSDCPRAYATPLNTLSPVRKLHVAACPRVGEPAAMRALLVGGAASARTPLLGGEALPDGGYHSTAVVPVRARD
jgi:hypothetical protein